MNYAFDLELTLDAAPETFRPLCAALVAAGHGVYVVTGLFPGASERQRRDQLAAIDFVEGRDFSQLRCCPGSSPNEIGEGKRNVCEEISAGLMVDDRMDFLGPIQSTVQCLLVLPRA